MEIVEEENVKTKHYFSLRKLVGQKKLIGERNSLHNGSTYIFRTDIMKSRFLFPLTTPAINSIHCTTYLHATVVAFQRKIIKGNQQPLVQGNKNFINAIKIVWIVAGISRTSKNVIMH